MNKEQLINTIYEQLDCKEPQTKEIIKHFLSDIQLFDKKQYVNALLNLNEIE